jgi:hypothetical protein
LAEDLQQQALLAIGGGAVHQNAARLQFGQGLVVGRRVSIHAVDEFKVDVANAFSLLQTG